MSEQIKYPRIWLQPQCDDCYGIEDLQWCKDDVFDPCGACGAKPVKYVLAQEALNPGDTTHPAANDAAPKSDGD